MTTTMTTTVTMKMVVLAAVLAATLVSCRAEECACFEAQHKPGLYGVMCSTLLIPRSMVGWGSAVNKWSAPDCRYCGTFNCTKGDEAPGVVEARYQEFLTRLDEQQHRHEERQTDELQEMQVKQQQQQQPGLGTIRKAMEYWAQVDLERKRAEIDEQALAVDANGKRSVEMRKRMKEVTAALKKTPKEERVNALRPVMLTYQEGIDQLTSRAQYAERAFLALYKQLFEAPDPVAVFKPLMRAAERAQLLAQKVRLLEDELREKNVRLEEYDEEFRGLKNQEVTVRRLEDKNRELVEQLERRAAEMAAETKQELEQQMQEAAERHAEEEDVLRNHLKHAKEELEAERSAHAATKSQLFELTTKMENVEAASDDGAAMLVEDLERANTLVLQLGRDKEELRSQIKALKSSSQSSSDVVREQERQLQEYADRLTKMRADLQLERESWEQERAALEKRVAEREAAVRDAKAQVQRLSAEVSELPSRSEYRKLKKQLHLLQEMEFSVIDGVDDNEEALQQHTESERILLRKNKALQSELTHAKVALTQLQSQHEQLVAQHDETLQQQEVYVALVARLENELEISQRGNSSSSQRTPTTARSPSSSASSAARKATTTAPDLQAIMETEYGQAPVSTASKNQAQPMFQTPVPNHHTKADDTDDLDHLRWGDDDDDDNTAAAAEAAAEAAADAGTAVEMIATSQMPLVEKPRDVRAAAAAAAVVAAAEEVNVVVAAPTMTATATATTTTATNATATAGMEHEGQDDSAVVSAALRKAKYLGVCFLFLFFSFSVAQNFVTSLHADVGFVSLAIVYAVLAMASFVAPAISAAMGLRTSLVLSAVLYAVFVFTISIEGTSIPMLVASFFLGNLSAGCERPWSIHRL
eukprot:TRINITY_DN66382_c4_g4_i2.p1 TRINITY_DN66382_c4_g4~~TRINITY_DN66382_c4_g4_i2.p1  ORF type:complete len:875 (+),score=467.50 TRINITY_DN66382_c4_g4_i2:32-2656(+)